MSTLIFVSLAAALIPAQTAIPFQPGEAVVDRGRVNAGAILTQRFELRNRGAAPVTITEVLVGCGCQRHRLSRKVVPPLEAAELVFDINTLPQAAGPNAWNATVKFIEGNQPARELQLRITANIVREITVEPVSLFCSIDKEITQTVTIGDRRPKPLTVTSASCDLDQVKTQIGPKVRSGSEQTQHVSITVSGTLPPGRWATTLVLTTDDPEYRELRVPIVVTRKMPGQVIASPEQVDLRLARGQKAASGLIRLRADEDRPVVVDRIESEQSGVRCKWAAGPGSMATLRVGVELEGGAVSGSGSVKVYLKQPGPQVLVIPISWQVP